MNYISMRILSFVFKLSGGALFFLGLLSVLIGLAGGSILAGALNTRDVALLGALPALAGVAAAVGLILNGVILFGFGEVVDAVIDIHQTSQATQAQLHQLVEQLNAFAKEQRNPKLPAHFDGMQDALQGIQFNAKRAAAASEELLAIAQRARRSA
jgi:hypothetical protein